jgi:glycosyltransferase involved in cell wall biosynthesis
MRLVVVNLSVRTISGGYEEYLRQFFSRAARDESVAAVMFVAVDEVILKFAGMPKLTCIPLSPLNALLGTVWGVAKKIRTFRPDVIYIPMEKRLKGLAEFRKVVMLQNMEPFARPDPGNSLLWKWILKIMRRRAIAALQEASHVIALSNFAADGIHREAGIEPERVTKIPHGISPLSGTSMMPSMAKDVSTPFLFTAGSMAPARGVEDLVRAYVLLRSQGRLEGVSLCIAGSVHKYSKAWLSRIREEVHRSGFEKDIRWLDYLTKAEMQWCFENSSLFVITSRVESFCITAVEAMAASLPVISTQSPCLPETLSDYPDYYQAGNWRQLADLIPIVLDGHGKGSRRLPASLISWDENYARTMALFKKQ